jgi:hypothetical protein
LAPTLHRRAISANRASGIVQNQMKTGKEGKAASGLMIEVQVALAQDMFHLRNGAKQRLARELIGRLSMARAKVISRPLLAHKRSASPVSYGFEPIYIKA